MSLIEVLPLGHDPDIKGFNFTFSHTSLNKKNNKQHALTTTPHGSDQGGSDQEAGKI